MRRKSKLFKIILCGQIDLKRAFSDQYTKRENCFSQQFIIKNAGFPLGKARFFKKRFIQS
jgi:hypothetical protein